MKPMKQVFALAKEENDEMDTLLVGSSIWCVLRIGVWINWFLYNASHRAGEAKRAIDHIGDTEAEDILGEKSSEASRGDKCL